MFFSVKLRTIIVDDELLARERLRRLLAGENDVEVVAECGDGAAAIAEIERSRPDLLLLDIQMPEIDGFEVLRALDGEWPEVIFVTAFDEYAVRAFEVRALDYLLKPVTRARLRQALLRARERCARQAPSSQAAVREVVAERSAGGSSPRRLLIKNGERIILVRVDQIDWAEAAGNYVILHVGTETHISRQTFSSLEAQLPGDLFFRVSRSAMVNSSRVKEFQAVSAGEYVAILENGHRVVTTRSLRELEERMSRG